MSKRKTKRSDIKEKDSFINFLFSKEQRIWLLIILGFYLIVYFVLTFFYPFPDGISDSGGYVLAASINQYRGFRPFGYSKFLIIIHHITSSVSLIVFIQYFLNAVSTIFFLFTIKYFFKLKNRFIEIGFDVVSICSITVIYLTNSILSDALFTSLTLFWLAFGFWVILSKKLTVKIISLSAQLILLYFLVNVRYTGLFYFGIEIILLFMVFYRTRKPISIAFSFFLIIIALITYQKQVQRTEEIVGIEVFSGFSGWQIANNALHAVPYINPDLEKLKDKEVKEFTAFAKSNDTLLVLDSYNASASFLWDKKSPLKQYLFYQVKIKQWKYLKTYTYLGKNVYSKFGTYILTHYPFAFTRYYLIPNLLGTLYPTSDQLYRNFNQNAVPEKLWQDWFEIEPATEIDAKSEFVSKIALYLPIYRLILWLLMFISIVYFFIRKPRNKFTPSQLQAYLYFTIFVVVYFVFHIYSAPFELRYVAPIHLVQIALIKLSFSELLLGTSKNEE